MPGLHPNLRQCSRTLLVPLGLAEAQFASFFTGVILKAHPINLLQTNRKVDFPIVYISVHFLDLHNPLEVLVSSLWFFWRRGVGFRLLCISYPTHQYQPHWHLPRKHVFTTCFVTACLFCLFIYFSRKVICSLSRSFIPLSIDTHWVSRVLPPNGARCLQRCLST